MHNKEEWNSRALIVQSGSVKWRHVYLVFWFFSHGEGALSSRPDHKSVSHPYYALWRVCCEVC